MESKNPLRASAAAQNEHPRIDRLTNFLHDSHTFAAGPKSRPTPNSKKSNLKAKQTTVSDPDSIEMAAGPGEAMAHSAFDTILVLDFG